MHPSVDPIETFRELQARARESEPHEGIAVCLATANATGQPSARVVLLKGFDERGFVFYTNYESPKGCQIGENPHGALCFYWSSLNTQVRAEGTVRPVSEAESDAYFASRPRGSQIGAWASRQSQPIASRAEIEHQVAEVDARFDGREVERPPHWGGFRLAPQRIEFWNAGEDRLHDRFVYTRTADGWSCERLQP